MRRLLLLSNSKNYGQEYLQHAVEPIERFLAGRIKTVTFVPYAGVTVSWDAYANAVRARFETFGVDVRSVHETDNAKAAIEEAEAVAVGGGNTFRLIEQIERHDIAGAIRERVLAGMPYMGWSAGSNVACPSICTTNDMPIVQPRSFRGLGLVPFQINPHYLDAHPEKHQGETREQRILEFIELNRDITVAGLREGSILRVDGNTIKLLGNRPLRVFRYGQEPMEIDPGAPLDVLLTHT